MVQYIITPWRTHSDLLHVRSQLYQDAHGPISDAERQDAVARVAVWMQRGNCPHLVESTAVITAAILNDRTDVASYCVRAAYAAAFARFVTGLLDSHQSARHKLSMYAIAKTINLPATFVELRHQAIHEELPSLAKLRTASRKALRWIWDYYWSKLPHADLAEGGTCAEAVRMALNEHDEGRRNLIRERLVRKWGVDEVLGVLMSGEFYDGEEEDPRIVLRSVEFSAVLMSPDESQAAVSEEKIKSLEDLRAEIARMDQELNVASEQVDVEGPEVEAKGNEIFDRAKGWNLWEGDWVPKPIGVV